ncbi:MAG: hypothetical protein ACI8W8_002217 [Rhodothermales bacterium]|jgi:hypothetical protein
MLNFDKRFLICMAPVLGIHIFMLCSVYLFFKPAQPVTIAESDETAETPERDPGTPIIEPDAPDVEPSAARLHQVISGDSYWSIANKHAISVTALLAYNGHDRDRTLQIGEVLKIPDR